MMKEVDFTHCPRVQGRAYNGANGKKIAVSYEDEVWILKFPPNVKERPNEQSYSNSCISDIWEAAFSACWAFPRRKRGWEPSLTGKPRWFVPAEILPGWDLYCTTSVPSRTR